MSKKDALDKLGLNRICCRSIMLTHVDILQISIDYERMNSILSPIDRSSEFVKVHSTKKRSSTDGIEPPNKRLLRAV